ncbi:hypothetical protein V6N13_109090 [Hibiscus sabdariffa]
MCSIYFLVLAILLPCCVEILSLSCCNAMKETLRYLAGIAGPSGYGSKTTAEQVVRNSSSPPHHLTAIITGATSGIGAETARVLAKRGVRVVIPARDLKKAVALKEGIQKENPNAEIVLFEIDLSSLASVGRFCTRFLALGLPLNILINNAGIFSQNLEFSEDKIEMTFATNYLGTPTAMTLFIDRNVIREDGRNSRANRHPRKNHKPFFCNSQLGQKRLLQLHPNAQPQQVINHFTHSLSLIYSWTDAGFYVRDGDCSYNATRAYAQSKLANILHAKELTRQLKARNARVTINAVHPGIVKTGIIRAHKGFITGRFSILHCFEIAQVYLTALSPQAQELSGKYFADCNECNCSALADDESEARRLWRQTRALIHRRLQYQLPAPS